MTLLNSPISEIYALCKAHKVKYLYAFGSVLNEKFNEDSAIDLVVDFQPLNLLEYAHNYFDLKFSLEDVLKRPIDLLEEKAIKNPYFREDIDKKRKLIYG